MKSALTVLFIFGKNRGEFQVQISAWNLPLHLILHDLVEYGSLHVTLHETIYAAKSNRYPDASREGDPLEDDFESSNCDGSVQLRPMQSIGDVKC